MFSRKATKYKKLNMETPKNWIWQKKTIYENIYKCIYEHICKRIYKHIYTKVVIYKQQRERTSLFSSDDGYMTVEASIVVPLFFIVMMGFALWIQVFRVEAEIQKGVTETGKYMARQVYKYERRKEESKESSFLLNQFSAIIIKNKWKEYVDEQFLENCCLLNGIEGISFQNSKYDEESDSIDIHAKYKIQISLPFIGIYELSAQAKTQQKAFTGYNNSSGEYVYVTKSGTVFHTNRFCPHIALSITKVYDTAKYESGKSKYKACEKCTKRYNGGSTYFYITKYGDKYHTSLQCSSLKRTIQKVKLGEVGGLGQCLKCQQDVS